MNLFIRNSFHLLDVNECSNKNAGCSQSCVNTPGSYHCACKIGYTLAADKKTCNGMYDYLEFLSSIENNIDCF